MPLTEEQLAQKEKELQDLENRLKKMEEDLKKGSDNQDFDSKVKEAVAAELKDIKAKLDDAYTKRDEALKQVKDFEKEKQDAEIARLKEEGNHKDAFEREKALMQEEFQKERDAWKEERSTLLGKNTELTRDNQVKEALGAFDFRSESAYKMASHEIKKGLKRDDNGNWIHESGISVEEYVKEFSENEDNSFLFKQPVNSGGGGGSLTPDNSAARGGDGKSIFEKSQGDVLAEAKKRVHGKQ